MRVQKIYHSAILKSKQTLLRSVAAVLFVMILCPSFAVAQSGEGDFIPMTLEELQGLEREAKPTGALSVMPLDIRRDAVIEAAISYGARGGLVWKTYEIRQTLKERARYLDKVFDFSQLLIAAPSGLLIEPPVVSEAANALLIKYDAQEAVVSDRVYHIIKNARIVSTPRSWHTYLERDWGENIEPPPDILRPENEEERKIWIEHVTKGWEHGTLQAEEIFQDDLAVLSADLNGMIRYRMLLAQGMITPPRALQVDRGITGGGREMRVGDRKVQITGVPELIIGSEVWKPANR